MRDVSNWSRRGTTSPAPLLSQIPVTILIPPAVLAVAVAVLVFLARTDFVGQRARILHRPRETQPSARNFETVSEHVPGV